MFAYKESRQTHNLSRGACFFDNDNALSPFMHHKSAKKSYLCRKWKSL